MKLSMFGFGGLKVNMTAKLKNIAKQGLLKDVVSVAKSKFEETEENMSKMKFQNMLKMAKCRSKLNTIHIFYSCRDDSTLAI